MIQQAVLGHGLLDFVFPKGLDQGFVQQFHQLDAEFVVCGLYDGVVEQLVPLQILVLGVAVVVHLSAQRKDLCQFLVRCPQSRIIGYLRLQHQPQFVEVAQL